MEEKDINTPEMPQNEEKIKTEAAAEGTSNAEKPVQEKEQDPVTRLKDELAESRDKFLRLYAEFENYRRRTAKERLELIQNANENLMKALLPVTDDFDRAEKALKEAAPKESEGITLVVNKFRKILEQNGLKIMDTSSGNFDPDFHEAITQVPVPDKTGKIIDVVEKGYLLNDKVIRHAKVVVGA
ncbi:MAG: nucleotide exchange factor GrpE [Cyclobacteriaceae bacterium]|jgi:molecular chaperone GrpE